MSVFFCSLLTCNRSATFRYLPTGFTLIELLIALAISAILAMVAIPTYSSFVERSKMRSAQADLVALVVNLENVYQRKLSYPDINSSATLTTEFPGWVPTADDFSYSARVDSKTGTYLLQATGQGQLANCVIQIDNNNKRDTNNCPQGDGDWI